MNDSRKDDDSIDAIEQQLRRLRPRSFSINAERLLAESAVESVATPIDPNMSDKAIADAPIAMMPVRNRFIAGWSGLAAACLVGVCLGSGMTAAAMHFVRGESSGFLAVDAIDETPAQADESILPDTSEIAVDSRLVASNVVSLSTVNRFPIWKTVIRNGIRCRVTDDLILLTEGDSEYRYRRDASSASRDFIDSSTNVITAPPKTTSPLSTRSTDALQQLIGETY